MVSEWELRRDLKSQSIVEETQENGLRVRTWKRTQSQSVAEQTQQMVLDGELGIDLKDESVA